MNKIKMVFLALLTIASTGAHAGLSNVYEIYIKNAIGEPLQISEVVALSTDTGADLAYWRDGASAVASSNWSYGSSPLYAIDGVAPGLHPDSIFHSASGDADPWLKITLASPAELDSLTLYGRTDRGYNSRDVYNVFLYDDLGNELFSGSNYSAFNESYSVTIDFTSPIPEPSTLALMALGLVSVGFAARRRKA